MASLKAYSLLLFCLTLWSFSDIASSADQRLHDDEVVVLQQIAVKMGTIWNKPELSCGGGFDKINITCSYCDQDNVCHVDQLRVKDHQLTGYLPPELVNLTFLRAIDITRNLLWGPLPAVWSTMKSLNFISLTANRLSGEIPREWGNFPNLTYLSFEGNNFSGSIPPELGNLVSLTHLFFSSNNFAGRVPNTLGRLTKLIDLRFSDNNFEGQIPDFIGNLTQLTKLEMFGSGFEGPISSTIFQKLRVLKILLITDMAGPESQFPIFRSNQTGLIQLVLRSLNLVGTIPESIWKIMPNLDVLDVSFNNLEGNLDYRINKTKHMFFTGNKLSGHVPSSFLSNTMQSNTDLSYNNFTWPTTTCNGSNVEKLNTYRSSGTNKEGFFPCPDKLNCQQHRRSSLYINCGGPSVTVRDDKRNITYEGDTEDGLTAARSYVSATNWGFSSTGDFLDIKQNFSYIMLNKLGKPEMSLYATARISPLSLTYFACMEKGTYTVMLHFAEVVLVSKFRSIGRRVFDIYIQGERVEKDFNIVEEADKTSGNDQAVVKQYLNVIVTDNTLEIRFYWAGKGTRVVPARGFYGALVSAISVFPNCNPMDKFAHDEFEHKHHEERKCRKYSDTNEKNLSVVTRLHPSSLLNPDRKIQSPLGFSSNFASCNVFSLRIQFQWEHEKMSITTHIVHGIVAAVLSIIVVIAGAIFWKRYSRQRSSEMRGLELLTGSFSLRQLRAATGDFDEANKLGEGGFGAVYKGRLSDGRVIAVKQMSSRSKQGNREFITEIGMISGLQHPSLVKLYGCCIEGNQLLLVYEYMENNSLGNALFGKSRLKLEWPKRFNICVNIAKGIYFLHEESALKILHRDIKATNVLLDKDLSAKISDFGLAKLHEADESHITTRVAGTIGYMAPEYALWGYLTEKADVYSFGVVALETVSGKSNTEFLPQNDFVCLLEYAFALQRKAALLEIVDPDLGSNFNKEEAERVIKVALLCTNASAVLRPTMMEAIEMLEGRTPVHEVDSNPGIYGEDFRNDIRFKTLRAYYQQNQSKNAESGGSKSNLDTRSGEPSTSNVASRDLYEIDKISERNIYQNSGGSAAQTSDMSSLMSRRSHSSTSL